MRRKKSSGESKEKKHRSSKKGARRFFSPVLRLLVVAAIVAIVIWQFQPISEFFGDISNNISGVWDATLSLFGLGLIVLAGYVAILIWLLTANVHKILSHWRQLLASIPLGFGIFGLLAFFRAGNNILKDNTLGGAFGQWIIGAPDFLGGLTVFVLFLVTFALLAPRAALSVLRFIWKGLKLLPGLFQKFGLRVSRGAANLQQEVRARRSVAAIKEAVAPAAVPDTFPAPEMESAVQEQDASPRKPSLLRGLRKPKEAATSPSQPVSEEENWSKLRESADALGKTYQKSAAISTSSGWKLPSTSILDDAEPGKLSQIDVEKRSRLIESALSSYGVEAKVVQVNVGPTVTQFGLEPGWDRKFKEIKEKDAEGNVTIRQEEISKSRVKIDRITSLANDLALALATPDIRIEAPIPGKAMVGIEVPNTVIETVTIKRVIEGPSYQKLMRKTNLALALGKGAGGEEVVCDLAKMPHLLIAGATGSGKTVCLDTIIVSLLMNNTPRELQFVLIDPKRVELTAFNSIPHLAAPVVVESSRAVDMLNWANLEMDDRYRKFATCGARNIQGYNTLNKDNPFPYLVIVIDELADLMMAKANEVEISICRLAQLARATGIHLVVATQRPSVDVITGLIKANFPSRISFSVASQIDSRTILDSVGAEKLLGHGDMLYHPIDAPKAKRAQGCYVSDQEMERIVHFWNSQQPPEGHQPLIKDLNAALAAATPVAEPKKAPGGGDALLNEARQLCREHGRVSASFLQRRLGIGYPRAARLVDILEDEEIDIPPVIPEESGKENIKDDL